MEYNNQRTRESLNNLTPEEYRLMAEKTGNLKKCVELKRVCLHHVFLPESKVVIKNRYKS